MMVICPSLSIVLTWTVSRHVQAKMKAMPTTYWLPMSPTGGIKECRGCPKIGRKSETEIKAMADALAHVIKKRTSGQNIKELSLAFQGRAG